jgi:hypothetical protein
VIRYKLIVERIKRKRNQMLYQIFQIQFSDQDIADVNADMPNAKYTAKRNIDFDFGDIGIKTLASEAFDSGLYTHVANITGNDLEHVFQISNLCIEDNIQRLGRKSSLSVGDIIVDGNGIMWVCDKFGFEEIVGVGVAA